MSGIRSSVNLTALTDAISNEEKRLAKGITAGMGDATNALKSGLRRQVEGAGLGQKLAYTWQGRTYPQRTSSLHPKGFVWSKAPEIISIYANGGEIVPLNGHRYLAIPTKAARAITGKKGARLTVAQLEARLGRKIMVFKGKRGNLLGLYDPRTATSKRRGTKRDLILLYTFIPMVKVRQRFDVPALVDEIGNQVPGMIAARISS